VSNFNAHAAIVFRDEKDHAIVCLLAAQLPAFRNAYRILLDALGVRGWHNEHGYLTSFACFKGAQRLFQRSSLIARERIRKIANRRSERWYGDIGECRCNRKPPEYRT
jgi:hypothetical protein